MKAIIATAFIGILLCIAVQICLPIIDRAQARTAERYGTFTADNCTFELILL